jgi:hypothetical protein
MMPATTANEIAVLLKHFSIAESVCPMLRPSMRIANKRTKTHTLCVYTRVYSSAYASTKEITLNVLFFACVWSKSVRLVLLQHEFKKNEKKKFL